MNHKGHAKTYVLGGNWPKFQNGNRKSHIQLGLTLDLRDEKSANSRITRKA
jgi:hypothetical protein